MAVPVNVTLNQQFNNVGSTGGPFNVVVSTTGSAIVVYVAAYRASTTGELVNAPTATGLTFTLIEDDAGTPVQAKALKAMDSGGGTGRIGHYVWIARNVTAGTHAVTINFVNSSANMACAFAMEVPRVPTGSGYCDVVANVTQTYLAGRVTVTASTGNLANARNTVLAFCSGVGTNTWGGAGSDDNQAPTGLVKLRAFYDNFPILGVPYQASYVDTNSTASVSATWGVVDNSLAEGYVATIIALRDSVASNYVEILIDPLPGYSIAIDGSTGWDVRYSAGDPKDGLLVASNLTAQPTNREVRIPTAPPGTTVGQEINISVLSNPSLAWTGPGGTSGTSKITSGDIIGTVRAAS